MLARCWPERARVAARVDAARADAPLPRVTDLSAGRAGARCSTLRRRALPPTWAVRSRARAWRSIFEKPSNRTRHSMEMAVFQLGGHPVYTRGDEVGFDERETVEDVTRILAGYHAVLAARVFARRGRRAHGGGVDGAGGQPALRPRPPDAGARRRPHHASRTSGRSRGTDGGLGR